MPATLDAFSSAGRVTFAIDDAPLHEIAVIVAQRVVAKVVIRTVGLAPANLGEHDRAVDPRVLGDLAGWRLERMVLTLLRHALLLGVGCDTLKRRNEVEICDTAARDDAFRDSGPCRMQRIVHARFALLHRGLRRRAHADDGHTTGQFGGTLRKLFPFVFFGARLDLSLDLRDPASDHRWIAVTLDDSRSVVLMVPPRE